MNNRFEIDNEGGAPLKMCAGRIDALANLDLKELQREIEVNLALLINQVEHGGSFAENPLSSFIIEKHRTCNGPSNRGEIVEMCRQNVLSGGFKSTDDQLSELRRLAVTQSLIMFAAAMERLKIWTIGLHGKKISGKAMSGHLATSVAEVNANSIVEGCSLTREKMADEAAKLYPIYHQIIRALRATYFGAQSRKLRRLTDKIPWKQKRAEVEKQYPALGLILDRVSVKQYRPRELALEVIAERYGTSIETAERLLWVGNCRNSGGS